MNKNKAFEYKHYLAYLQITYLQIKYKPLFNRFAVDIFTNNIFTDIQSVIAYEFENAWPSKYLGPPLLNQ